MAEETRASVVDVEAFRLAYYLDLRGERRCRVHPCQSLRNATMGSSREAFQAG